MIATETGHPRHHGFLRCVRCGCWRRVDEVGPFHWGDGSPAEDSVVACLDQRVCGRLAGAGDGRMDADTGEP